MSGFRKLRQIEDAGIAFAMTCDDNGLSVAEGIELAERIGDELQSVAEERRWQDNVPGNSTTA